MEYQQTGGYDFKTTEKKAPQEYVCLICQLLLKKATELPCSHVYCQECLLKWEDKILEESKEEEIKCSLCNQVYQREQKHPSRALDRIITTSLDVLCQQHKLGCEWIGKIIDFQQHHSLCDHVEVSCRFDGCDVGIQKRHLTEHEIICPKRLLACIYCEELKKICEMEKHVGEECLKFVTQCPNSGCQFKAARNEIRNHLSEDCLFEEVNCLFHQLGCDVKTTRQHRNQHNIKFNSLHSELLLNKYQWTNKELESTKQSLHKTNQDLQNTKQELQKTNLELQETKESLKESNETIKALDDKLASSNVEIREIVEKVKEKKDRETLEIQTCFKAIEKSTITISDQLIKQTENRTLNGKLDFSLLPLLDENHYLEEEVVEETKVEYNGQHYDFLVQQQKVALGYEERIEKVLRSMDNGHLYHANEKECYFKLKIKENGDENYNLIVGFDNVKSLQQSFRKYLVFGNNELCLLDLNGYQLCIDNNYHGYQQQNSSLYLYHTKTGCNNLSISYNKWNNNMNLKNHESKSNEILFHLVKK